jgi:hypothetical protein
VAVVDLGCGLGGCHDSLARLRGCPTKVRVVVVYDRLSTVEVTALLRLMNGVILGPTGGRIVGGVFIGLLQLDPNSYLRAQPNWTPTLPSQTAGTFSMTDLLRFARVDPASRGQ